jgi:hypothetical protein
MYGFDGSETPPFRISVPQIACYFNKICGRGWPEKKKSPGLVSEGFMAKGQIKRMGMFEFLPHYMLLFFDKIQHNLYIFFTTRETAERSGAKGKRPLQSQWDCGGLLLFCGRRVGCWAHPSRHSVIWFF